MALVANSLDGQGISPSLEDYLETIYLLVQDQGFARVKDVARARDVKAASVSIALRKLADLALVRYERREYIALTPDGEKAGRRVFSRHRVLTRFFEEVLNMGARAASEQACAMEHSLTDEAMDRLVGFFEVLGACPSLVETLGRCALAREGKASLATDSRKCAACAKWKGASMSLTELRPGQGAVVAKIAATGVLRKRLLDMGMLPETPIDVERGGLGGGPFWVRCQGARVALNRSEASSILVHATDDPAPKTDGVSRLCLRKP
jgi:DtxR family transcriptional regulator, Mn-dependent transcriptional regulator